MKLVPLTVIAFFSFQCFAQANNKDIELPPELAPHSDQAAPTDLSDDEFKDLVFRMYMEKKFKLSPEQIRTYLDREREQLEATKRQAPAKSVNELIPVDLKPGAKPSRLYASPGFDSFISFIDVSGMPWPISYLSGGNKEDFPVEQVNGEKSHTIRVASEFRVGSTNLSVYLEGMDKIITVEIVADKERYHSPLTLQVPQFGPNSPTETRLTSAYSRSESIDKNMQLLISGGTSLPNDFEKLKSSNPLVEAWEFKGELYLLSRMMLSSVDPISVRHGPGGYHAYRVTFLPSLLFTNDNGVPVSVSFSKDV